MFKKIESQSKNTEINLDEVLDSLKYNEQGLVPCIAQQSGTGEVLMMAWMNRDALDETLKTGRVCYWSRSRSKLWRKGESSGQVQMLKQLKIDCDGDTLLAIVDQTGPACHTGRRHCFYLEVTGSVVKVTGDVLIDPADLYKS